MTPERFDELWAATLARVEELARGKGGEYAPGADRLSNFKQNAERLGLTPLDIWAVYAGKHWDAIQTYVQDLRKGISRERLEGIEGRFHDLIVYAVLGLALVEDCPTPDEVDRAFESLRAFCSPLSHPTEREEHVVVETVDHPEKKTRKSKR